MIRAELRTEVSIHSRLRGGSVQLEVVVVLFHVSIHSRFCRGSYLRILRDLAELFQLTPASAAGDWLPVGVNLVEVSIHSRLYSGRCIREVRLLESKVSTHTRL